MAREIRVTFTDKEQDIYDFIKSKSSASNFIKDLVKLEKERQENYKNSLVENNLDKLAEKLANKIGSIEPQKVINKESNKSNNGNEYDFDIDDIIEN
ncbi:hypothetical protein PN398_08050 [Romboutsia sp. 1001216sp1]|uniref:hypothetical protein n=1 Tax=unclassified Romboutsia TaxID=2626894 RepID=UPI0018A0651D|nr:MULTISPECIES: hypothetical protein [unclassified Romboutsia]MDB8790671.1 hypothetical protein [Romboutsia sp. 1001216sp1]MDB8803234.1 hypothetical protein [Romboutsia sp. 1001216sp1]MDB8814602.1 hypothetical protein [Romboutsia sp. 1001216sp1]